MKPKNSIRRFDVFAEYQRLKALEEDKQPPDVAKGYGIWLAKVVASRKFRKSGSAQSKETGGKKGGEPSDELVDNKWRTLDGEAQTDALFDKEIVQRMGEDFYNEVFSRAVAEAFRAGEDYTDIRDKIRKDWTSK